MSGAKVINALKEAIAGDLARVWIDGVCWEPRRKWQPIETAPKDGTPILGYAKHWPSEQRIRWEEWGGEVAITRPHRGGATAKPFWLTWMARPTLPTGCLVQNNRRATNDLRRPLHPSPPRRQ